ncbi:MAG: hypothetical protein KA477_00285 [Candidatus Levybacteria bacterium]|nr:hypothetical protein [Candidatus Levybacteria bacterium]
MNQEKHLSTPKTKETIKALWRLQKIVLNTLDFNQLIHRIVDGLLTELGYFNLGYRIIVLTLYDTDKKVLKRISLSSTNEAKRAQEASAVPFSEIDIPYESSGNLLIKTLKTKSPQVTHYWPDIFKPVLSAEQALANQKAAGIKTSLMYPVIVNDKAIGVLIFSLIKEEDEVSEEEKDLISGFTDIVGLAVQNSKLYSSVEEKSKDLRVANLKLKQLDKLKDEFVSIASHELRTPLTVIRSYVELLITGKAGKLNTKQYEYLERVFASSNRLANLVSTMLDLSRIESGRIKLVKENVDITDLVNEVVAEMKAKAEEQKIDLTITGFKDRTLLLADKERIREVMINLVGNALKYTPTGGSVGISMTINKKEITISIKDTGIGISQANMDKLFKKFGIIGSEYSVKKGITSTGLGLYLSQQLVQLHGGKIWVESEGEGKGSTFIFSLPIEKIT